MAGKVLVLLQEKAKILFDLSGLGLMGGALLVCFERGKNPPGLFHFQFFLENRHNILL